jgi:eukaryotic-like serine/threonine-protein kinase
VQETSGAVRAALLDQSDPDVREAVEALLANDRTEHVVLDRPAWELASQILESSHEAMVPRDRFLPGEQLGPYQVKCKIGSGGMGEVYRAEDPRLGRSVAIKASAVQFSQGFEREAKAIAALNHPNICQIYDIGPDYLIMEYVKGVRRQLNLPSVVPHRGMLPDHN